MKKGTVTAMMLSLLLIVQLVPVTAYAADGADINQELVKGLSSDASVNPNAYADPFASVDKNGEVVLESAGSTSYPESYDMRDKGIVTPVKQQSPFGTCWGFAAIAAAETSILNDLGKTYDEYPIDLSERHLAYFALGHIDDPNDSQYGEGHWWEPYGEDIDTYPWLRMNEGGEGFFATTVFAAGIGPVEESEVPYINKKGYISWDKFDESGDTIERIDSIESPGEEYVPRFYSKLVTEDPEGSSWSVDESEKYQQKYELEESCMLPTPAGTGPDGKYLYNPAATEVIKGQIYEGKPVQIGFFADTSKPDEKGEGRYINYNNWAHYKSTSGDPNHAVTIIGWDDNFSKENFNIDYQPPEDGAWLVKNSWGSETRDFPHHSEWGIVDNEGKHTGYFWLSYYDRTLTRPETLDFYTDHRTNTAGYYYVDGYDFMPIYSVGNTLTDNNVRMSNIFTAEGNMNLFAVSCQTATPDSTVTYRVYTLDEGQTTPENAKLVATVQDSFELGGFHRTNLEEPVYIAQGQKYAVEVEITTSSGQHELLVAKGYNEEVPGLSGDRGYSKGVVNEGESILYNGESYVDWTTMLDSLRDLDSGLYDYDNFTIKAYSDPVVEEPAPAEEPAVEEAVPSISKAKLYKVKRGKRYAKAYWKKLKNVDGYSVAYRKSSKSKWQYKDVPSSKTSVKIKKLKKGKYYRFKVRGYVETRNGRVYGKYSKTKKARIK